MQPDHLPGPLPEGTSKNERQREIDRLEKLARLLDSAFPLVGNFRIGVDGLIGLIPGIGDLVGASLSTYMVVKAAQLGASTFSLIRMMSNILIESLVGIIPILGDLFDVTWRANERNMRVLQNQLSHEPPLRGSKKRLTTAVILLLLVFVLVLFGLVFLAFSLLWMLISSIG